MPGQIVLMRELMVVFNGNEISLGMMLATWLFWTAAGSSLSSSLGLGAKNPRRATAVLECLLAASLPATIWALRAAKSIFQTVPGELVGPLPMLLTTLVCLSVFCAASGALFVVCGANVRKRARSYGARGRQLGLLCLRLPVRPLGGILASLVLLRFLDVLSDCLLVGAAESLHGGASAAADEAQAGCCAGGARRCWPRFRFCWWLRRGWTRPRRRACGGALIWLARATRSTATWR